MSGSFAGATITMCKDAPKEERLKRVQLSREECRRRQNKLSITINGQSSLSVDLNFIVKLNSLKGVMEVGLSAPSRCSEGGCMGGRCISTF